MNARDFFESVRDAALEETRTVRQIERMRLREGVRGASLAPSGGGPKDVNGLSATNARMDYEAMMSRRLKEDRELIDKARAVLYGAGEPGGVAVLLGSAVADAVASATSHARAGAWSGTSAALARAPRGDGATPRSTP